MAVVNGRQRGEKTIPTSTDTISTVDGVIIQVSSLCHCAIPSGAQVLSAGVSSSTGL